MKKLFALFLILTSFYIISCENGNIKNGHIIMTVEPETGSYYGINPRHPIECLLVKIGDNTEVQKIGINEIKNFKYEKGYNWKLEVKTDTLKNPPADKSSVEYSLIKILSKTKAK